MKETATKTKKTPRKTPKPVLAIQPVFFRRIVVITSCLVLAVVVLILTNKQEINRAVAGTSIARGLFMQSTIVLPAIPNAVSYNIYYKQSSEKDFSNAVRNISPSIHIYTISYLKKNTAYEYRVTAVDNTGKEFFFSDTEPLVNLQSM